MATTNLSVYEALINRLVDDLEGGKIKPENLDQKLISTIFSDLKSGAEEDSPGYMNLDADHPDYTKMQYLKRNMFVFSAAKSYRQLEFINQKLLDDKGQFKTFADFKKAVTEKVNGTYNKTYLQAEHQTAKGTILHARKWQQIQRSKHLYPNLLYVTAGDERVREEHRGLAGTIRPVDDPFWDEFYPPNGWRCRCTVRPVRQEPTDMPTEQPEILPDFKKNVGKSGYVFSKNHPYFKFDAEDKAKQIEVSKNIAKAIQKMPLVNSYKGKKGGYINHHPLDTSSDFEINYTSSKVLADNGVKVDLRIRSEESNKSNPDAYFDKVLGDIKHPTTESAISGRIKKASDQEVTIVVLDLINMPTWTTNGVFRKIKGAVTGERNHTIEQVWISTNKKLVKLTREEILNGSENLLKRLKD